MAQVLEVLKLEFPGSSSRAVASMKNTYIVRLVAYIACCGSSRIESVYSRLLCGAFDYPRGYLSWIDIRILAPSPLVRELILRSGRILVTGPSDKAQH